MWIKSIILKEKYISYVIFNNCLCSRTHCHWSKRTHTWIRYRVITKIDNMHITKLWMKIGCSNISSSVNSVTSMYISACFISIIPVTSIRIAPDAHIARGLRILFLTHNYLMWIRARLKLYFITLHLYWDN